MRLAIMLRGTVEKVSALVHSPPLEGWQAKPDGVVAKVLYQSIPLLWKGGRHKHFVMHAFSNHVEGDC